MIENSDRGSVGIPWCRHFFKVGRKSVFINVAKRVLEVCEESLDSGICAPTKIIGLCDNVDLGDGLEEHLLELVFDGLAVGAVLVCLTTWTITYTKTR